MAHKPSIAAKVFDLSGKVALVTGGSRGLGRQMALAFADAGADVVISSRKLDACEAVATEVESRGRAALAVACHAGRWGELDGLVEAAYQRFGRLDVLVNNAGLSPVYDTVADVTEQLWDSVFAVNAKGPFRLAVLAGTRMVQAGGGTIINVSASGTRQPVASLAPYLAAKSALNAITVALADAFAPTVRVNTLMPGPFLTDMSTHWTEKIHHEISETVTLRRSARAEEVVGAALFLASDASSFTTGSTVRVDGG